MKHKDIIDIIKTECECSKKKAEEIFDEYNLYEYEDENAEDYSEEECEEAIYRATKEYNDYIEVTDNNYWSSL